MTRASRNAWLVYGAVAGLAALLLYDQSAKGASGFVPIHLSPGLSSNIPAPAGGQVAFVLPAGSKGWLHATQQAAAGLSPITLALPAGPGASLDLRGIVAGSAFLISWLDDNSAEQQAFVIFQAA